MEKKSKNILIITQAVNKNNLVLGFFHRWIEEFAKNFEFVTVVCLEKGCYELPNNVKVLSLGKENGKSKIKYIYNFYKYIWQERKNYDAVFVHMNQEYVLIGGLFWKIFGKKITLWRNHPDGGLFTRIAVSMSDKVYCTSKSSFTASFNKTLIMPVGIDTSLFKPDFTSIKSDNSIICLGRIAPIKNLHIIIEALRILKERNRDFGFYFYGDCLPKDAKYLNFLNKSVADYGLSDRVSFMKGIPNCDAPRIYNKYEIFINITNSGSFDKTILEAMSCGLTVFTSNNALAEILGPDYFIEHNDPLCVADKLDNMLLHNLAEVNMRDYVVDNHSIYRLVSRFKESIFGN